MLSIEQKKEALRCCPLFSGMEATEIGVLSEAMEEEFFQEGEEICVAGETADRIYVVYEGELSVYLPGIDEPVRRLIGGQVLGEYGMFTKTRTTTILASKPTLMLSMDYERFQMFLFSYPKAMFELFKTSVRRLIQAEDRLRDKTDKS